MLIKFSMHVIKQYTEYPIIFRLRVKFTNKEIIITIHIIFAGYMPVKSEMSLICFLALIPGFATDEFLLF